jgi:uncharacterized protein (TIGR00288 family)
MENGNPSRVALFLDAENLIIEAQKSGLPVEIRRIMDRLREEGVVSVARAYADWTEPHTQAHVVAFYDQVLELTQLATRYGKNTGDIQIVVDALEMALSPNSPDIFVLIAGDRDFVPLVQRLRRHGKRVIGVGLLESTSRALENACDTFLYYDHLIAPEQPIMVAQLPAYRQENGAAPSTPAAQPTQQSGVRQLIPPQAPPAASAKPVAPAVADDSPTELREPFNLLLRAVITLERKGQLPTEYTVNRLMQQLDPRFDLSRYPFARFADFAQAAASYGYVRAGTQAGMLTLESARPMPTGTPENPAVLLTHPETTSDALQSYRSMLAEKRVPLIRWNERQILVEQLWTELARFTEPKTVLEINEILRMISARHMLRVPDKAVEKMVMSLKIARALEVVGEERFSNEFGQNRLRPAPGMDAQQALRLVNEVYVNGIRMDYPQVTFQERALALLLFDRDGDSELAEVSEILGAIGYYRR